MNSHTPNERLIMAVSPAIGPDSIDDAKQAIADGADVNCIINPNEQPLLNVTYLGSQKQTLLFLVQTPEMMSLLLDNGANPNIPMTHCRTGETTSLLHWWADGSKMGTDNYYNILIALANHRPCYLSQQDINTTLILLLEQIDYQYRFNKTYATTTSKAVESFSRISNNLQEKINIQLPTSYVLPGNSFYSKAFATITDSIIKQYKYHFELISPFSYSSNAKSFNILADSNFYLWKDIENNNIDSTVTNINDKWKTIFQNLTLTKFYKQYCMLWLGISRDDKSSIYSPVEILMLIMQQINLLHGDFLAPYREQLSRDNLLKTQKIAFEKIYAILNEHTPGYHSFLKNNQDKPASIFMAQACKDAADDKNTVTKKSFALTTKYHKNLHNPELLNTLTDDCMQHKFFFFASDEKKKVAREELQREISMKL